MTETEARALVVEALAYASVFTLRDRGWTEAYLAGARDIAFTEIEMDSLAVMELCIAVEVNTGVSIVPDDLERIGSLAVLAETIRLGLP